MSREVVDSYRITEEGFDVGVKITGGKGQIKIYEIVHAEIPPATQALLDSIKQELIGRVHITAEEILDPKIIVSLKKRFKENAKSLIEKKLPGIEPKILNNLVMILLKEMLGLGDLEIFLSDPNLEEIVVTSANEPIRVFHKKFGWLSTNIIPENEVQIRDHFNTIARRVGRQITTLNPLLDAHLLTGDRANAVLYPISSKGNTLTIRMFARDPWTVTDFIKNKTCSSYVFALIWFVMQYEGNILISGGTGSGKTSFLNICMPFIPPNHRIVSIEDTRELMLPEFLYWCPLTTRLPNPEGKGEITMLDLLINSLRMRPDRIILGEMRKKDQAEVLFEAMHTGHSVYATVHADSVISTIQRLTNPPIEVPPNLLCAVNLNVVMFRNRKFNIRRIYQLGEFLSTEEEGESKVKGNIIYRWNPGSDKLVPHQKSIRLFEELSRHTGLNQIEMNEDIAKKEKILNWMVAKNIRDLDSVGKVFNAYYLDTEELLSLVQKNGSPEELMKLGNK
ncbi:MAG: Flp pilus assembly complex ATPase component TadA [Nanoarchaeota archaeon]|nr:Flp pilus assembly complex ATPase component TadA [Nanoarchaeota archaeon]MBU1644654.1 Flp pilus assembly complex ATPase component TadA [Nanoarchaeota archaeon]MBU1977384.1 Flp pilus assembly complex ATPase component TadA [Nanoarchaeota archaeon]